MNIYQKDYNLGLPLCTFEQAKELKELGFPQDKCPFYNEHGEFIGGDRHFWKRSAKFDKFCAAPVLEIVNRWLMAEKEICLSVQPTGTGKYACHVFSLKDGLEYAYCVHIIYKDDYEESLSRGIDKAIEMLRDKQAFKSILQIE